MRRTDDEPQYQAAGGARFALLSAVAVVGVVAVGIAALATARAPRPVDLRALASATSAHRITRARLTGGFRYVPCRERGADDRLVRGLLCEESSPDAWREAAALEELGRRARAEGGTGAGGAQRHFRGAWELLWGDAEGAISELREAARLEPANARVQSDLGAALLAKAEAAQDPLSLVDAYVAIDSALVVDSTLAEARFNRALVLEWLHLRPAAIDAWRSYLAVDRRSRWSDEAGVHLARLEAPAPTWGDALKRLQPALDEGNTDSVLSIVRGFPRQVREEIRGMIAEWARQYSRAPRGDDPLIVRSIALAQALEPATGDALWADETRRIGEMIRSGDRTRLDAFARGVTELVRGERAYDVFAFDSAAYWFDSAHRWLVAAGSGLAHWATYDRAKISYQRHDYDRAMAQLQSVLDGAPESWLVLRGLALRTIGFIERLRANPDAVLAAYAPVMGIGRFLGEPVIELRARTDAALLAATLRGESAAWQQLYDAFRSLARYAEAPIDAQHVFIGAAELTMARSPRLALLFQRESLRHMGARDQPALMIAALTMQARLLARAGQPADALVSLRRLGDSLDAIMNDSVRVQMRADAALVHAEVWLRDRPDSSIHLLRDVVQRYDQTDYSLQLSQAQFLLASAYAAQGAADSARVVFERALTETERQRAGISGLEDRAHFLDQARAVIDSVLRFLVNQNDTVGALDFLERMRARVLLEQVHNSAESRLPVSESVERLRLRLVPGMQVVSFAALDGELLTWVITRERIRLRRVPLDDDLDAVIERFTALTGIGSPEEEVRPISERLYELFVAPVESEIEPGARLVFVPDKALHNVPFAALFDGRRGRFLVEVHEISVAPSVQLLLESSARFRALRGAALPQVLAVGDPEFDTRTYSLPSLPRAREEAGRVAARYAQARLLTGRAATRSAFFRAAPAAGIIHFAGHGIVRPDAPLRSHLVLAPDPRGTSTGALYASDLFALRLPWTRLAILSGCHTASGQLSHTEGASSLARAFFAAGVPAVIASLWAVSDAETAEFFDAFHRDLALGRDPVSALRDTQLGWVARPDRGWRSIATWAAFQLFGATGAPSQEGRTEER